MSSFPHLPRQVRTWQVNYFNNLLYAKLSDIVENLKTMENDVDF